MKHLVEYLHKNWILLLDGNSGKVLTTYNTHTNELYKANKSKEDILSEIDALPLSDSAYVEAERPDFGSDDLKPSSVVIAVAERCNVACKYCFASAGTYNNAKRPIITEEMMDKVRVFISQMNPDEQVSINFFGGEPILAINQIVEFCREVKQKCDADGIICPDFSMTSNGTLLTDSIVEQLAAYDIQICLSIDGPQEMHDMNRVYPNQRGTFADTMRGVECLKRQQVPFAIEATLTLEQIKNLVNQGTSAYFDFFKDSGAVSVVINVDGLCNQFGKDEQEVLSNFLAAMVDDFFVEMSSKMYEGPVLNNVLKNCQSIMATLPPYKSECAAGLSQIFVSADGEVYPCQTFYACKAHHLGNIGHPEEVKTAQLELSQRYWQRTPDECHSCSYSRLCFEMCPGMRLLSGGAENKLNEVQCFIQKELIKQVLYQMSHLPDAEAMQIFESNMMSAIKRSSSLHIQS